MGSDPGPVPSLPAPAPGAGEAAPRSVAASDAPASARSAQSGLVASRGRHRQGAASAAAGQTNLRTGLAGNHHARSAAAAIAAGRRRRQTGVQRSTQPCAAIACAVACERPSARNRGRWRDNRRSRAASQSTRHGTLRRSCAQLDGGRHDRSAAQAADVAALS